MGVWGYGGEECRSNRIKKPLQKARHPAPLAGREEVDGYENLPVILVENFASLTGSRTRAFRLLKSPAVDPSPKAA